MTDSAVILGLDVRIIASIGVAVAAFFSVRVSYKSYELQKTMGKNAVLNAKYQNELNCLQKIISGFAEIRVWAFETNNPKRSSELDRSIDEMKFNTNVLKALGTSTSVKIEEWEMSRDYGNSIPRLVHMMLRQDHGKLNVQSDGEYFTRKQNDLNKIQEKLFDDITGELGL